MPEIDNDLITYKDVTQLDLIPAKDYVGFTDTVLLIQQDASRRATLYTLLDKLKEAVTVVNGKSAYELAVDHGFVGTEEEWLKSIGSSADLRAIAGNYVVIDAGWSGNSLVPTNPDSATIPDGAMVIYQVKQKDSTYEYYTINDEGTGYDEWYGILPIIDAVEQVVREYHPQKLYYYPKMLMDASSYGDGNIYYTTKEFKYADAQDKTMQSDILNNAMHISDNQFYLGQIYEIKNVDTGEIEWQFNVYGKLHEYEGVAQYIQTLMHELSPIADSAKKLTTPRKIWVTNTKIGAWEVDIETGEETPTSDLIIGEVEFDGSKNVAIEFKDGMINAALLARDETIIEDGKVAINILGSAEKLANARKFLLRGTVSGSATFDGTENVEIITQVDGDKVIAGSAKKLTNTVDIKVVGGGSNEGNTKVDSTNKSVTYFSNRGYREDGTIISGSSIYTWYETYKSLVNKYDGVTPVELVLTKVNASVLYGDTDADINITGSAQSAKTFNVGPRNASTDMVLTGVANSTDLSDGQKVIYDENVYIQNQNTKGQKSEGGVSTVVSPQFKGTLIGKASSADVATALKSYTSAVKSTISNSTAVSVPICEYLVDNVKLDDTQTVSYAARFTVTSSDESIIYLSGVLSVYAKFQFAFTQDGSSIQYTVNATNTKNANGLANSSFNDAIKNLKGKVSSIGSCHVTLDVGNANDFTFVFAIRVKEFDNEVDTLITQVALINNNIDSIDKIKWTLSPLGSCPLPSLPSTSTDTEFAMLCTDTSGDKMRAKPDTDYSAYRFRNISLGTSSTPTVDADWGGNGSIYFQYS